MNPCGACLAASRWITVLLLLFPLALCAQPQTYTPAQVERLAKLSELYGHVKFFHPYLGYKKINWDSAYAQNAPLVARAGTDAETAEALRRLLAVLGDPATTVRLAGPAAGRPAAADSIQIRWEADSTLVLKTNAYAEANSYPALIARLTQFAQWLPKAKTLLLDLRSPQPLSPDQISVFSYVMGAKGFARALSAQPYPTAAVRLRGHSGFAPEEGGSSGGYYSYFYTRGGEVVQPHEAVPRLRTAILLNENSVLPAALYALHDRPQVRLFATGPATDAGLAETLDFAFSATITVALRTGELVNTDGSLGLVGVAPVPPTVRPEAAGAYALAQLRAPRPAPSAGRPAPAAPAAPASASAAYPPAPYPALGYRLLAGAKTWAVIHYFFAYRDLMPDSWDAALRPALGELAAAPDATAYNLAVAHFYRHLQDGHGSVFSQTLREYLGTGGIAAELKFIDHEPVISKLTNDSLRTQGLRVGDVLLAVNGEPVAARVARLAAIQSASNEWTRLRYVADRLLRSPAGTPVKLDLRGADNRPKTITLRSLPLSRLQQGRDTTARFRVLPGNIGYADLGRLEGEDINKMFAALKNTRALIFDMRGYPHGTAWGIAPRLSKRPQPAAANFFRYTPTTPSLAGGDGIVTQKLFFTQSIPANNSQPVYQGKTVMLIDERTQSQAEHTGLFFEAANGTEFIGSPTAGADGDVTRFGVPGGITLSFSGHDVRHADGRQLQQVGLQPKIAVRPTLKGLRAGRDEVLARALKYLTTGT